METPAIQTASAPPPAETTAGTATAPAPGPAPADDLVAAIRAHAEQIQANAARPGRAPKEAPAPAEATATTEQPAEQAAGTPAVEAQAETPAPAAEEAPAAEGDQVAPHIAKYIQQQRQVRAEQARVRAELAAVEQTKAELATRRAELDKDKSLRELAEKDPIAAAKALLGDRLKGDFFVDLINQVAAEENGTTVEMTDAQKEARLLKLAEDRAVARIKAEQETATKTQKDAEAKRTQEEEQRETAAREGYFIGLNKEFKSVQDQYPFIVANKGFDPDEADKWIRGVNAKTGKFPSGAEIFQHFEQELEADYTRLSAAHQRKTGAAPAPVAAPAARSTAAQSPVPRAAAVDTKGKAPIPVKGPSYRERADAIAARLDATTR